MLRCLLLAAPGAGKGTQGERIAARHGVPHISTGDLLREEVRHGTPMGVEAAGFVTRGELVPDHLVMALVLDGFPRTLAQAERAYAFANEKDLTFHAVIALVVPEDVLVERVLDRGKATGRPDDTPETMRRRLQLYRAAGEPLLEFYRHRGILVEVDGTGTVDEVTDRICAHLDTLDLR